MDLARKEKSNNLKRINGFDIRLRLAMNFHRLLHKVMLLCFYHIIAHYHWLFLKNLYDKVSDLTSCSTCNTDQIDPFSCLCLTTICIQ